MKMNRIKCIILCAMCIALCYVLPIAFHALALGKILSPMHIPVLLCGIICGPLYGLFCGIAGPILSSLISGMPPVTALISMLPELAVYGLVGGLLMKFIRTKHLIADVYASLIPAMILGRIAGGIADALFYLGSETPYSINMFVSSYLIGSFPSIIIQLILIPILALTLEKAKLLPARYCELTKDSVHE